MLWPALPEDAPRAFVGGGRTDRRLAVRRRALQCIRAPFLFGSFVVFATFVLAAFAFLVSCAAGPAPGNSRFGSNASPRAATLCRARPSRRMIATSARPAPRPSRRFL